eukprot:13762529-Heterocapsa_arctica.AAC.1
MQLPFGARVQEDNAHADCRWASLGDVAGVHRVGVHGRRRDRRPGLMEEPFDVVPSVLVGLARRQAQELVDLTGGLF